MRKTLVLFTLATVVILAVGCGNQQRSSEEEARYTVTRMEDFADVVLYFSVESQGFGIIVEPEVYRSSDDKSIPPKKSIVHIVVYRTKAGARKIVLLDDNRPSRVVGTKDL